jgi:hypothetical protein
LAGEFGMVFAECRLLGGELGAAVGERLGARVELVEVNQPSLIGVDQAAAFALGLLELAFESVELA